MSATELLGVPERLLVTTNTSEQFDIHGSEGPEGDSVKLESSSKSHKIIALVLLSVASLLLWIAGSTYLTGLTSLGYKNVDGRINKIVVRINPIGQDRIATVNYEIDGRQLESTALMPRDRLIKNGEKVDVYYDPGNQSAITLTHEVDYDTVIVYGALGFFALSFGSFILYRVTRGER